MHITNVLLDPSLKSTEFFHLLNISNGFVAPAFVFCAGSGLWIALSRKGADYLKFDNRILLYLKRLSYILFWAYVLHVPNYSFQAMTSGEVPNAISWLQIDVLQAIVYGSVAALAVFLIVRDLTRATYIYGALAVLIGIGTPLLWLSGWLDALPPWIAIMVKPLPDSPFPLLPWVGYLFAGAFFTGVFMNSTNKKTFAIRLLVTSAFIPAIVLTVRHLPPEMPWDGIWWQASPGLMLFRISGVTILFALLYLVEDRLQKSRAGKFMQLVGMESLFIYLSHLFIVYGALSTLMHMTIGVSYTTYVGVVVAWLAITLPLCVAMLFWHRLKRERPVTASRLLMVQVVWMILAFLMTPAGFSFSELLRLVQ